MASSAAVEHSIEMPGAQVSGTAVQAAAVAMDDPAGGGESQQRESAVPPADAAVDDGESSQPEKHLNRFVYVLATAELVGDALGKVASLWATFILLGGYRKSLKHVDFWIATAMVFLEALRVFIRSFKLDSQSLFGSTKAFREIRSSFARLLFRPQEGDAIVLIISMAMAMFAHQSVNLGILGGIIRVVVLTVMSRAPLTETMMRQLQQRRPKKLLALLIFPLAHAVLTQVFLPPILKGLLPRLLDSLGTLTQAVAVVLLYFRPRRIGTLTNGPRGRHLLHVSKLISAPLAIMMAIFPSLSRSTISMMAIVPSLSRSTISMMAISHGLVSAISMVVLLLGSLQDPTVPNGKFVSRYIDWMTHFLFLLYGLFPLLPVRFGLLGAYISEIVLIAMLQIGNLQIPVTVVQIALSSWRLASSHGDSANMVASIKVFYALELCQGLLYIMACILAFFSVVPRRLLARRSGFGDDWGARAVDLYYERAYTERIEIGVFAEDTISLASFVADSHNSASSLSRELHLSASSTREVQLVGIRILHSLLQQKGSSSSNEELISVITRSEKAVPTLISMLDWTFKEDRDIRLFAAKATADLAGYLRIARIAGAVKSVSSLLDAAENQQLNDEGGRDDGSSLGPPIGASTRSEQGRNCCPRWCSWVCKCWQCMKKNWPWRSMEKKSINSPQDYSLPVLGMTILERLAWDPDNCAEIVKNKNLIPKILGLISYTSNNQGNNDNEHIISSSLGAQSTSGDNETGGRTRNESPLTSQDSLPTLGMKILERLACDSNICAEIVKNTNLIPEIIGLISYTSHDESSNDNALMISSSLKLVRMIATTNGKVGATLRQELWESPFLLRNLTGILEDSRSSPEVWKPVIDIIATLALDEGARHELGSVQVIIHKLLHIFITGRDGSTSYDQSLRVAAGETLAILAMESPENCLAMLEEQQGCRYDLVQDLKGMLDNDEYRCVAASLLQNLCECSRTRDGLPLVKTFAACYTIKDWLSDPGVSNQLSSALRVVLQNIMAAEGKQLEALIGLASQICYVQGLESHIIERKIVQKLVNTLNSNKKPSYQYPRMRRAIVDMVISILRRRYPGYAIIFSTEGMIDALSKVETTPSKVEKYRVFLGKEGVVLEHGLPLRELVATAKSLIHPATSDIRRNV